MYIVIQFQILNLMKAFVVQVPGASWGEIGGHNGQKIRIYADKFEQHAFERVDALIVPVVKSQAGKYDSKVTFYIWDGSTVYPEIVLAQKDYFIRDIPKILIM